MAKKIVFMGTPMFAVPILKSLYQNGYPISDVYTQPPQKSQRGQKINKSPIQGIAETLNLDFRTPKYLKDNNDEYEYFKSIDADLAIVVAYGQIIPKEFLSLTKKGFINIHASLLPKWRGAAPIQRSIMNLDKETGVSVMKIAEQLDTGPVCNTYKINLDDNLNSSDVAEKLSLIAAEKILDQLINLGLEWDGELLYQSTRLEDYDKTLQQLAKKELCYECDCSRSAIKSMGSIYNGQCRNRISKPCSDYAIRLRTENGIIEFNDLVQGNYRQNLEVEIGDFVIVRKDKLFAYQLAVVADDALQNITHIIRGNDLIDSTPRQIYLQQLLNYKTPIYGHIPIIVNAQGQKLSKQHFATPIDTKHGPKLIHQAMKFLGLSPPATIRQATVKEQLAWGIAVWDIQAVPKLANIPESSLTAE